MSLTTTESRSGQAAALNGPSTAQVVSFLTNANPVDVSDTLIQLWAESTLEHAENGYAQQARILAAILDRNVNPFEVVKAMDACEKISQLQSGHCLVDIYGCANIESLRDFHLDAEQQILAEAARACGGNR